MRVVARLLLAGSGLAALAYGIAGEFVDTLGGDGRLNAILGVWALNVAIEWRDKHRPPDAAGGRADVPVGYTPSPFVGEPPPASGGAASDGGGRDGGGG